MIPSLAVGVFVACFTATIAQYYAGGAMNGRLREIGFGMPAGQLMVPGYSSGNPTGYSVNYPRSYSEMYPLISPSYSSYSYPPSFGSGAVNGLSGMAITANPIASLVKGNVNENANTNVNINGASFRRSLSSRGNDHSNSNTNRNSNTNISFRR